jgi:hypothetical protein
MRGFVRLALAGALLLAANVVAAAPIPQFITTNMPGSITIGQSFSMAIGFQNHGTHSDDGRIVVSFPAFTNAGDGQWLNTLGDPNLVKLPAGGSLTDVNCLPMTATCASVEYRDSDWPGSDAEFHYVTMVVRPLGTGPFVMDVRCAMHGDGDPPCVLVNGVPTVGDPVIDQQGFPARRIHVDVNPGPPVPVFMAQPTYTITSLSPGQTTRLTLTVRNDGGDSDDGRIVVAFPSFIQPSDVQWVAPAAGTSSGDLPGYIERPAGELMHQLGCGPLASSNYLTTEYDDQDWRSGETHTLVLDITPQAAGVFEVYMRATMHRPGANDCDFANVAPTALTYVFSDQQGWRVADAPLAVSLPNVQIATFLGPITGIPSAITLGQSFTFTATLRNIGTDAPRGEIRMGFPALTHAGDFSFVQATMPDNIAPSGANRPTVADFYSECCVGGPHPPYLFAYGWKNNWAGGGTMPLTMLVTVTPQQTGPFDIDVHGIIYYGLDGCSCTGSFALPSNGVNVLNPYGVQVKRFTVMVNQPTPADVPPVTTPRATFALAGALPNPAHGELAVGFTLPGSDRATLELYDLRGRLIERRDVGSMGAGDHRLVFSRATPLSPGVYMVRLRQGGRVLSAKAALTD